MGAAGNRGSLILQGGIDMNAKETGAEIARDFFRRRGVVMVDEKALVALVKGSLARSTHPAAVELDAAVAGARAAFYTIAAEIAS